MPTLKGIPTFSQVPWGTQKKEDEKKKTELWETIPFTFFPPLCSLCNRLVFETREFTTTRLCMTSSGVPSSAVSVSFCMADRVAGFSRDPQSGVIRIASSTRGNLRNASSRQRLFSDILGSSDLWLGAPGCRYRIWSGMWSMFLFSTELQPPLTPLTLLKVHIFCTENVTLKSMSIFCIHLFNVSGVKEKVVVKKKKVHLTRIHQHHPLSLSSYFYIFCKEKKKKRLLIVFLLTSEYL